MSLPVVSGFPFGYLVDRLDLDSPLSKLFLNQYAGLMFGFDGGGDFVTESKGNGEYWVCPEGVYEVFAYLTAGSYLVDGDGRRVCGENTVTAEGC